MIALLEQPGQAFLNFSLQIENCIRIPHSAIVIREAEVGKPKSNWELQELLGLTALIMDSWKGDNQYEKPGIIRKKASCPFWLNWQVVLEPTSPSFTVERVTHSDCSGLRKKQTLSLSSLDYAMRHALCDMRTSE